VDLVVGPPAPTQLFALRLFAEHQFAHPRAPICVPPSRAFDHVFRPGIAVQETTKSGWRWAEGRPHGGRKGARLGLDVSLDAAVGRFAFARMAAAARAGTPLARSCSARSRRQRARATPGAGAESLVYGWTRDAARYGGAARSVRRSARPGGAGQPHARGAARRVHDVAWATRNAFATAGRWCGRRGRELPRRLDPHRLARALRAPKGWRLEIYSTRFSNS